jgi:hypothetical protein
MSTSFQSTNVPLETHALRAFLAELLVECAALPLDKAPDLPLSDSSVFEFILILEGRHPGVLGLRTEISFGFQLLDCVKEGPHTEDEAREACLEFLKLLGERLIQSGGNKSGIPGFLIPPLSIRFECWTDFPPTTVCRGCCRSSRLELYYWGNFPEVSHKPQECVLEMNEGDEPAP